MFGYIKPMKPEMKISEFDTFQAIYCGLCKQLSHVFGPFSSLTLSYDFTFVATLALALNDENSKFAKCRCVANPLKKKTCLTPCDDLTFCASTAMLLIYYKVKDDIEDDGFLKKLRSYAILPFVSSARKKAKLLYGQLDEKISAQLLRQKTIEDENQKSIDRACDPSAASLSIIFEQLSENEKQKKILSRLGYLIGRYVYFCDALDDIEEDKKRGCYNPFLAKFQEEPEKSIDEIKQYAIGVLNITVGEIPPAYELLNIKRYKPILDNIIYLGLHSEMNSILNKTKKNHKA